MSKPRNPKPSTLSPLGRVQGGEFGGDELPTRPRTIEFEAAMLVRYFRGCDAKDRDYLVKLAERLASRNGAL